MKLTPEQLAKWNEAATSKVPFHGRLETLCEAVPALIADLEEATAIRGNGVLVPAPKLEEMQAEVAALRQQLAGAQAGEARALADMDQLCESGPSLSANDFELIRMTLETRPSGSAALDAAITEAIADEKQNPWKRAIIHCLIINHILNARHETDPVRALADLIDWECKVALDSAVSEEARVLIEKYRKDAERLDYLQAFARCDPKMDGEHVWWSIHPRPTLRGNTLRAAVDAAIDAAIAAKGEKQ